MTPAFHVAFPYGFDNRGRTAGAAADDHIHDLIEQVLFTSPGERVNRPEFGCGLMQMVFAPNSIEVAAATQYLVQAGLQQNLGSLIDVNAVTVSVDDSILNVTVTYTVRTTQEQTTETFTPPGGANQ